MDQRTIKSPSYCLNWPSFSPVAFNVFSVRRIEGMCSPVFSVDKGLNSTVSDYTRTRLKDYKIQTRQ